MGSICVNECVCSFMNATINGQDNLKHLFRALSCISKVGDQVAFEGYADKLVLSALNSSKSALATITFSSQFFESYQLHPANATKSTEAEATVVCKLLAKPLLAVFRQRVSASKDRDVSIEWCDIRIEDSGNASNGESRLVVVFHCRYGVLKTYRLIYEESEVLHAVTDQARLTNEWSIRPQNLKDLLDHFSGRADEICIRIEGGDVQFTSFTEGVITDKGEHTSANLTNFD